MRGTEPLTKERLIERLRIRLDEHSTVDGDCMVWTGYANPRNGYGQVTIAGALRDDLGRVTTAHRAALYLKAGPAPNEKPLALHSCDNRLCVNPDHLRWGDYEENMADRLRRSPNTWGETHHSAKLSDAEVAAVMVRIRGGESCAEIAAEVGMSRFTLYEWKRGEGRGGRMP